MIPPSSKKPIFGASGGFLHNHQQQRHVFSRTRDDHATHFFISLNFCSSIASFMEDSIVTVYYNYICCSQPFDSFAGWEWSGSKHIHSHDIVLLNKYAYEMHYSGPEQTREEFKQHICKLFAGHDFELRDKIFHME